MQSPSPPGVALLVAARTQYEIAQAHRHMTRALSPRAQVARLARYFSSPVNSMRVHVYTLLCAAALLGVSAQLHAAPPPLQPAAGAAAPPPGNGDAPPPLPRDLLPHRLRALDDAHVVERGTRASFSPLELAPAEVLAVPAAAAAAHTAASASATLAAATVRSEPLHGEWMHAHRDAPLLPSDAQGTALRESADSYRRAESLAALAEAAAPASAMSPAHDARSAQSCSTASTCCDTAATPVTCAGCCASTTYLDMSNAGIADLPGDIFANFPALDILYLTQNQLTYLPATLFASNAELTMLSLSKNELTALPPGLFANIVHMYWLDISNNLLSPTLPADIFSNITALSYLVLTNNKLTSLPESLVAYNADLRGLDLNVNSLSPPGLPASLLASSTNLETLNLRSNPSLSILPVGFLSQAANPNLYSIDLSDTAFANTSCTALFKSVAAIPDACFGALSATVSPTPSQSPSATASRSASVSAPASLTVSASPSLAQSPSATPSATAAGALFRSLPRTDLLGTLVGGAAFFSQTSEAACRSACLAAPGCDAYAFASGALALLAANFRLPDESAPCYFYANVTALVPNSLMNAGVLLASYS